MADTLTDFTATAILTGNATLDRPLTWAGLNVRRNTAVPTKLVGTARIDCASVADPFDLLMRLCLDKPWQYTCILRHIASGTNVRRLDVRGTHKDRTGGQTWINQTHKHRWSEAEGDKDIYTPDDITHTPGIPPTASILEMTSEYEQVFNDFVSECRILLGTGYFWVEPPYPHVQAPIPTLEGYP